MDMHAYENTLACTVYTKLIAPTKHSFPIKIDIPSVYMQIWFL